MFMEQRLMENVALELMVIVKLDTDLVCKAVLFVCPVTNVAVGGK